MTTIVTRASKGTPLTFTEADANFTNLQTAIDDHVADTADAHDASAISIADAGNDFTATDVEGALAELQADHEADATDLSNHLADSAGAHAASAISNTAAGGIVATTVQAAIDELDTEKAPKASPTFTGVVTAPTIDLTGGQIAFPATQSASAGANTLDDYEEGTWTPAFTGTFTYSVQIGNYTKIGRMVYVQLYIVWTARSGSGNSNITGLPFTIGSSRQGASIGAYCSGITWPAGTEQMVGGGDNGFSTMNIYFLDSGGGAPTQIDSSHLGAGGGQFQGSFAYAV